MKKYTYTKLLAIGLLSMIGFQRVHAQTCEWRYANPVFSSVDPDGAGPATGTASFTLQIRTITGTIDNVTAIGAGFAYQSSKLMLPTSVVCFTPNIQPATVTVSPEFLAASFTYNTVNHCNIIDPVEITGGQAFDRRASGTVEASSTGITLTSTWTNVFTITMWTLGNSYPQGGYVMVNAGFNGVPTPVVSNWSVATLFSDEYYINSPEYTTPLPLGGALPVTFSSFDAKCSNNGTVISWSTAQELNSDYFEVQRSTDGSSWKAIGRTPAAGNSSRENNYSQIDLEAGNAMYRIKQVDKNGAVTYTGIERENCTVKNISTVLYPVPASDVLNVAIKSDKAVRTELAVFDIHGKLVKKLNANIQNGTNNFRIDLNGLKSGDYILRSTDASIEINKTFTVIK